MCRIPLRLALVWAGAGSVLWWAALPASASSASVGTSAESWYQTTGCELTSCAVQSPIPLPAPLPAPAADPYAEGTLHVGVVSGQEQARTYVTLDLSSLPAGAEVDGGTLILPLAEEAGTGTVAADAARMIVCFMVRPFDDDADGTVAAPPAPDCTTSAPAHLVIAGGVRSFTSDLGSFTKRWRNGEANNGLAIMAGDDARAAGDTWHVAFAGKGSGAARTIEATIRFEYAAPVPLPAPQAPPIAFAGPPPLVGVPPAPVPPSAQPQVEAPVASIAVTTHGFEYAAIFLLPLVGLGALGLLAYSLTREVVVPRP